jgi:hypothetical protein
MNATAPKVIHHYVRNAPHKAPCPHCHRLGHRKDTHERTVRGIAYGAILLVHVTTGEYRARCQCCATFRTQVEEIQPKAKYTNQVRDAVLHRLLDDHMSVEKILQAVQRDFLLDLSPGFIYDCSRWKCAQLDLATYRLWTLEHFSGTLCIDEIHLGALTLLLATDPLHDFPVAFALVSRNDQEHMRRFLLSLAEHGFAPKVVVTDGSNLYPALLQEIWPATEHQLCIFHILKDLNQCVQDALRRLRRHRQGRGRRRRGRLRPRAAARRRRPPTRQQQSTFIFRHRHLFTQRRDRLTKQNRQDLPQMLDWRPDLAVLRQFVDQVHHLLEHAQTLEQAQHRFQELHRVPAYAADPDLARALAQLTPAKFTKMVAFLRSPLGQRVRTNHHVERMNRMLRHYEKVRYGWRTPRGLVRFVVLAIDRLWQQRRPPTRTVYPAPSTEAQSSSAATLPLEEHPLAEKTAA